MAKHEQRKLARILFVEQGKTRREIAVALKVREKTVGDWARLGNWEELRTVHLTRSDNVVAKLKGLMQHYAERLHMLEQDSDSDPKEKARLVDALSKASKSMEAARAEGDITLSARLRVMEWVFAELRKHDVATHDKLVDFQERLLEEAARMHA